MPEGRKFIYPVFIAVLFVFSLYLINLLGISYPLSVTTVTRSGELAVVGEGKIEAVPDTAYLTAGISVRDQLDVDSVQTKIDEINNKIIESLKKVGIPKEDIKTSNYSINPNYRSDEGSQTIAGYNGSASVRVKISDMTKVTEVLKAVTDAGANQVRGVSFSIDKPELIREQARDKAIQNAKEQAEKLANQLGIKLGKIINIIESSPQTVYPMYAESRVGIGDIGSGGPEIEPGSQTITSTVTLYFEKR